jgi:hypothetical protein
MMTIDCPPMAGAPMARDESMTGQMARSDSTTGQAATGQSSSGQAGTGQASTGHAGSRPSTAAQPGSPVHSSAVGSPQGTGTGSGLNAMPGVGSPQRLEGEIRSIGSTRTNRILEVGDLKLEVEPSTVILVGCKPASVADLKVGAQIKAAYEVKEPNRNLARVIEAQN